MLYLWLREITKVRIRFQNYLLKTDKRIRASLDAPSRHNLRCMQQPAEDAAGRNYGGVWIWSDQMIILYHNLIIINMYEADEEARQAVQVLEMHRLYQIISLCVSIILGACTSLLQIQSARTREPYHMSILTGEGWVMELLAGHKRIQCELGVSAEVFILLIEELWGMGYDNSKYVTLEEQLAIFHGMHNLLCD